MREIPIDVILSFPLPNYEDPQTRGPALVIVNGVLIALVVVAVLLRIYTRVFIKRWFGVDDIFIGFALLATIGLTAIVILANVKYGWNRHIWDVPFSLIPDAGKIAFTAKIMFTLAATFTRISLLCFYYRLVRDSSHTWFNYALHASMTFVIAVCIAFVALVIWQCDPIESYWVFPPMPDSKCLDEGKVTLACGVINCVADLLVTVLPIPIIVRLQMPTRQRIGVVFLLSLGFIVTIAGIIRTYFIWKSLMDSWDETWFAYPLWIAAAVEVDLAVICACAPALKPLLANHLTPSLASLSNKLSSLRPSRSTFSSFPSSSNPPSSAYQTIRRLSERSDLEAAAAARRSSHYYSAELDKVPRLQRIDAARPGSWAATLPSVEEKKKGGAGVLEVEV